MIIKKEINNLPTEILQYIFNYLNDTGKFFCCCESYHLGLEEGGGGINKSLENYSISVIWVLNGQTNTL